MNDKSIRKNKGVVALFLDKTVPEPSVSNKFGRVIKASIDTENGKTPE